MTDQYRVILFETEFTLADLEIYMAPLSADNVSAGLGAMVDHFGTGQEKTLILGGEVPDLYGIPRERPEEWKSAPAVHPALASLRAHGWDVPKLWPWMQCIKEGRPDVHILVHDWGEPDDCPVWCPNSPVTAARLLAWHDQFGTPWRSNGMLTGTHLLRMNHAARVRAAKQSGKTPPMTPLWKLPEFPDDIGSAEKAYTVRRWTAPDYDPVECHVIDANKAYLSAAVSGLFAVGELRPGPRELDLMQGGYWLVDIEPWTDPCMPDPAGYASEDGPRWVTTPTLQLLADLHERGIHGGFKILKSLVAPASQVLRPWGQTLRDFLYICHDAGMGPALAEGVKESANRTIGGFARPGGRVYRPDWNHTVIARTRANLWRRMDLVRETAGILPQAVASDGIRYRATEAAAVCDVWNPRTDKPVFPLGGKLGQFTYDPVQEG